MRIRLVLVLAHIQFILIGIYAHPYRLTLYRTKTPSYVMRGSMDTPVKPVDYCQKGLCPKGERHICCKNEFWGDNCPKPREGVNMERYRTTILDHHNNLRNRMHMKMNHLPSAIKLRHLRWDEELSVVAMRVTNYCNNITGSNCVNIPRFLNVAQSSYTNRYVNRNIPNLLSMILVNFWSDRYYTFNASYVHSFPENASKEDQIFANMINQRVDKLGCGMLLHADVGNNIFHFTCLYNEKIKPGQQLYEIKP
ncbi:venom allergen 3 isoform X1 [Drosophila novamexicana]|uniref:venom allergen 3 isoform X1 n=1 Tax=Drosophila novamexicana TaxID=47314 RepID=UPI0011E5F12D|nr:venom allergen 3 isoform X1 [Drosophila novamexicana]